LQAVLERGRVFEKLEADLEALRKRERSSSEAAAQFESSRIEAGPSREQAMNFIDLMTLEEGVWQLTSAHHRPALLLSRRRTQDGRSW
jgi:hypothetical protein